MARATPHTPGAAAAAPHAEFEALVRDELTMVDELLELEPDCKWPLAAAAFLGRTLQQHRMGDEATAAAATANLDALRRIDPLRARYYSAAATDAAGDGDASGSPMGHWHRQPGGFYATYLAPEEGAAGAASSPGVALPSFIESEFTTKVAYLAWRKEEERLARS